MECSKICQNAKQNVVILSVMFSTFCNMSMLARFLDCFRRKVVLNSEVVGKNPLCWGYHMYLDSSSALETHTAVLLHTSNTTTTSLPKYINK